MKRIKITKIRFQRDDFAIVCGIDDKKREEVYVGDFPSLEIDAEYDVDCIQTNHPRFGPQYKIRVAIHASDDKSTPENVLLYLQSGVIPGCGPTIAQKIYDEFGNRSLEIIRNNWEQLTNIDGISDKTALKIHEGEAAVTASGSLLGFAGITQNKAKKIFERYGHNAINIIKDDPYTLIYDIDGFSFKTVDAIAQQNDIEKDSPKRIAGAILFILYDLQNAGHCYCTKTTLFKRVAELLEIDKELIQPVFQSEIERSRVVLDEDAVYNRKIWELENGTAEMIGQLMNRDTWFDKTQLESTLADLEEVQLADEQRDAVINALSGNVCAITGGAGTGKTTVINTIARVYKALSMNPIVMCAPTGKAARRMTEATGCKAMTTARLVLTESEHPVDSLIICDEASMLDIKMAYELIKVAAYGNNQIIFVGDVNQLPPIGAGTFFKDILECGCINTSRLMICHRQSGVIAENAAKINEGKSLSTLEFDNVNTKFLYGSSVEDAVKAYKTAVDKYGVENVCLLLPLHKEKGNAPAVVPANNILRPAYNPNQPKPGCKFAKGDRVVNLQNDPEHDIANGDVGYCIHSDSKYFCVKMDSGVEIEYSHSMENCFDLAYALTIHKSQGSEYDCVIILITSAAYFMLERNLIYTAVTRGKKEVIMMGDKKSYGIAIHTQKAAKRNTKLMERIQNQLQ